MVLAVKFHDADLIPRFHPFPTSSAGAFQGFSTGSGSLGGVPGDARVNWKMGDSVVFCQTWMI